MMRTRLSDSRFFATLIRLQCALGFALLGVAHPAHAAWNNYTCSINSASLSFGTYNPLSSTPLSNNSASLTVTCSNGTGSGAATPNPSIALSSGSAASFSPRTLKSGSNSLNYNVFTESSYTTVWGDGTGSTATRSVTVNSPTGKATSSNSTSLTLYGRIPSGQLNAAAGNYSDTLTITVTY